MKLDCPLDCTHSGRPLDLLLSSGSSRIPLHDCEMIKLPLDVFVKFKQWPHIWVCMGRGGGGGSRTTLLGGKVGPHMGCDYNQEASYH